MSNSPLSTHTYSSNDMPTWALLLICFMFAVCFHVFGFVTTFKLLFAYVLVYWLYHSKKHPPSPQFKSVLHTTALMFISLFAAREILPRFLPFTSDGWLSVEHASLGFALLIGCVYTWFAKPASSPEPVQPKSNTDTTPPSLPHELQAQDMLIPIHSASQAQLVFTAFFTVLMTLILTLLLRILMPFQPENVGVLLLVVIMAVLAYAGWSGRQQIIRKRFKLAELGGEWILINQQGIYIRSWQDNDLAEQHFTWDEIRVIDIHRENFVQIIASNLPPNYESREMYLYHFGALGSAGRMRDYLLLQKKRHSHA